LLSVSFMRVASICAFLTVLTTIGVHWLPRLWENAVTFDAQVQLRHNAIYVGQRWMVLAHCGLVVISMAPVALLLTGTARLIAMFGFGSYIMFAFVEMLRTSLSIFAVNRAWRSGYEQASDDAARAHSKVFPVLTTPCSFSFWQRSRSVYFAMGSRCSACMASTDKSHFCFCFGPC